ncbi:MAG: mevalonate pyrophosphate decarboxylase [Ferroplasma sp.]
MNFQFEGENIRRRLTNMDLYHELENYVADPEPEKITYGYSYPIKAFEKFLGYYDKFYKIAYNPSVSFNTDFSIVYSACMYSKDEYSDTVCFDGRDAAEYKNRYTEPLNILKKQAGIKGSFHFYVKRYRKYPVAKGMSESSAVASATARSIVKNVFGSSAGNDDSFVSRYARLVSGSGTRAAINGPSFWLSYPGIMEENSFAFKIPLDVSKLNYAIFPRSINYKTSNAHEVAVKSIFYESWVSDKYIKINEMIDNSFDLNYLLSRSMDDMFNLNSVLMSGKNVIQTPESIVLLEKFLKYKKKNEGIYITGDTGPSLMVMSTDKNIFNEFLESIEDFRIIGSKQKTEELIEKDFKKEAEDYLFNL